MTDKHMIRTCLHLILGFGLIMSLSIVLTAMTLGTLLIIVEIGAWFIAF